MTKPGTPDLDEFVKLSHPKRPLCPIGIALELLTPEQREQLAAACATNVGVITNSAIGQWLRKRGHEASSSAITSHRRGTCTCDVS